MATTAPQAVAPAAAAAAVVPPTVAGGAQPQFQQPTSSLYVGDLVNDVTEAVLFEIFNKVGPVASVRVCRDAATRRSLGYAYVNFHRSDDAERALDTLNFSDIGGRPCRIMWSHRDPTLRKTGVGNIFVKNLAKEIDNKTLFDTFSRFGNILSCKIACNSKRESLGYGFVHFETDESARDAIKVVNGATIANQSVEVSAFKSKKERSGGEKNKFTNIYVKNLADDTTDERLRELFKPFGTVTSAYLNVEADTKKCRGFGFVNFDTAEQAAAAIEKMHNSESGAATGKKLFVCRAQKKEEREKELRDRFESIKLERQKKQANLYVKNLADTIDEARLRAEFTKFGSITSAKLMVDEKGKSRGFGFVCFTTSEEATKAVQEMNGKMLENKPLYVALAQRKEYRRAQLEAQYANRQQRQQQQQVMYAMPQQGMQGPMYFPQPGMGMPRGAPYPYPQMGMPRGGARWGPAGPQQMMMRQPGMNPQLQLVPASMTQMPAEYAGGMPPRGMVNGRGGRGGRQAGGQRRGMNPNQMPAVGVPPQAQQQIRYQPNAQNVIRNQAMGAVVGVADAQQVPVAVETAEAVAAPTGEQEPLTVKQLAAASPDQQKQMLGERLFPLVQSMNAGLAGKITGMLLEMENGELLHLIENPTALREKVQEALEVLDAANAQEAAQAGAPAPAQ